MDLLNLFRIFVGHKLVATAVVLAAGGVLAVAYVGSPPVYRASGAVVLLNPTAPLPSTTTSTSIPRSTVADPSSTAVTAGRSPSAGAAAQNPYLLFNDLSVVVDILVRVVSRPEVAQTLLAKGLVGTYTVEANLDFKRGPIIEVAAEADTADSALKSARLVIAELGDQLLKLQREQGTHPTYSIRTLTVAPPERATTVFSSALRRLVAVGGLCLMGIVGALMLAETVSKGRGRGRRRAARGPRDTSPGGEGTSPVEAAVGPPHDVTETEAPRRAPDPPAAAAASGGESSAIGQGR